MSKTAKQLVLEHVLLAISSLTLKTASRELQIEGAELSAEMNRRLAKAARESVALSADAEVSA